ncbi:hypothetical protein DPMN_108223 [Dreissena polymorpha]|uniref:Uncharacterized protein n=1 Tax=Dreissena polymorpha TaxID=45954 RepID=A0A9D4K848_DREPO|nr:hypothetical protein DPMN_108223 [Dreissena polymorpha]
MKSGQTPKNPEQLEEIPVPFPEAYRTNLIYDNESRSNRIPVFASGRLGASGISHNLVHGRNLLFR